MREEISARWATTDLHLHLEGALTPDRALRLAQAAKHVPPPPEGGIEEARRGRVWRYRDLGEFLRLFGWSTRLLQGADSYSALLEDLVEALRSQGVEYAEVFVAVGQMARSAADPHRILPRLDEIAREVEDAGGPRLRFFADATRQWGEREAEAVLDVALRWQGRPIVGFGMGGDERSLPARRFRSIYRRAAENGLRCSCHAGEGTHAEAVREVVEELGVRRVGHGIAAVDDPRLLRELAEDGVVLEVCPTSNLRTGAWQPARGAHPVLTLLEAGVPVVLGSDDPAFFGSSLQGEFELLREWGVEEAQLQAVEERARSLRLP